jgi:nucleotide-binding universal stress UspA family protein
MERHLLLTIGDDPSAFYAVRFACNFFLGAKDVKFTLFFVTPKPAAVYQDEREYVDTKALVEGAIDRSRAKGGAVLDKAREMVLNFGFAAENVAVKIQPNYFGTVEDIVAEAEEGLYDAVVLGRRGLSRFEEVFFGSVTKNIMSRDINFPIWICKRPIVGYKGVLLAVDDTEGGRRAADHVGFVLSGLKDHPVTVLNVRSGKNGKAPAGPACTEGESCLDEALRVLAEAGVDEGAVQVKIVQGDPAEEIFKEAESGKYAAIALGRTGRAKAGQPPQERKFMGSVTQKLLRKVESVALWVS